MVIPHLTENYGTFRDPLEKQAPICTCTPSHITLITASHRLGLNLKGCSRRRRLKSMIISNPGEYTSLMTKACDAQARDNLERVLECLDMERSPKCFPRPLEFSVSDLTHLNIVLAGSILHAETFGIPIPDWAKNPKKLAEAIDQKLESRRKILPSGYVMKPIQFEKDDDTNDHMDFIAGLANMRARNYSILDVDKLRAKFIVGRIIPAIATSTTMATGLVCLELYKVIDRGRKVEDYLNTFANLALPLFSTAESGLDAYSISCGSCLLFNIMFSRHNERMDKKVVDLARDVAKMEIPSYLRHLDLMVACEDEEENDIDISQVEIGIFFPLVVLRSLDGSDYPLNLKLSVLIAQGTQKVDQNSLNATQTGSIKGSSLQNEEQNSIEENSSAAESQGNFEKVKAHKSTMEAAEFNCHPVKGIKFLKSNSFSGEYANVSVAHFLKNMPSLDKAP
ncbi:ubiquitin-activating enzyme E1 1-like protein isoform X2 [Tanacetum coccineum]